MAHLARARARVSPGHSGQTSAAGCPAIDCTRPCSVLREDLRDRAEPPWWVCRCPPCDCADCLERTRRARAEPPPRLEAGSQLQLELEAA